MDRTVRKSYEVMYRLLAAWVNGILPEGTAISGIDFEELWRIADRHSMSAAVCMALEAAGMFGQCPSLIRKRFSDAKLLSVRRTLLMDAEREKLLAFMEKLGIWYMPLKGVVLKEYYPKLSARQMADNDILFDASFQKDVRDYMTRNGYHMETGAGEDIHDTYHKPPVYSFEMHRMLFQTPVHGSAFDDAAVPYYADVKSRLIKDPDNRYGWHFSDEDCYIYILAHAFKHYDGGGTGVRTLLDIWLYRRKKESLDEDYIAAELEKLGLPGFERRCRSISDKLFGWPQSAEALTGEERKTLFWMEESGVYGTAEHHVKRKLQEIRQSGAAHDGEAKRKYLLRRLFPQLSWYQANAPFCYRHRWAIPFYWAGWIVRSIFVRRKEIQKELSVLWRADDGAE